MNEDWDSSEYIDLHQAKPTFAHYAITELARQHIVKFVITTNMDGLHLRSGLPRNLIAEIHGNVHKEVCGKCDQEFYFRTPSEGEDHPRLHGTGRKCGWCGGGLKDSIKHFCENHREREEIDSVCFFLSLLPSLLLFFSLLPSLTTINAGPSCWES
jgi:NAD-dependent protein deacetylase sirtuin 6